MKKYYVYLLEDVAGNAFYVGKGSKTETYDRIEYHLKYWCHNKNKKLTNKIKKLEGNFKAVIIFESEIERECLDKEIETIEKYNRNTLCNLTDGGEGICGHKHSEITRAIISSKVNIDSSKKNLINAIKSNTGRRKGDIFKLEKLYETYSIYEIKELTGLDFVTIKNYLVEKNLYVKNKNRKNLSKEGRINVSNGQKSRNRKEVLQLDLQRNIIATWKSAAEATKNIKGDIRACLGGTQKTAGGFIWKYKN